MADDTTVKYRENLFLYKLFLNTARMHGYFTACALWIAFTSASAQITLKSFEDPSIDGYKSIVFEYAEKGNVAPGQTPQKMKKEFDIEANNPFNKLNFEVKEDKSRAAKVYSLNKQSAEALRKGLGFAPNQQGLINAEPSYGTSHTFVKTEKEYVVISYNFFIYDAEGIHIDKNGRFSSIYILNKKGEVSSKIENIPSDAYGARVSENGRYLAYAYGEYMEYTKPGDVETGFRIIDLWDNTIYFERKNCGYVQGIGVSYGNLIFTFYDESGKVNIALDENTGYIYGPSKYEVVLGYLRFMQENGNVLTVNDLKRIK